MRIGLRNNIRVINLISNNLRVFLKYEESLRSELYISKKILDQISKTKNWQKEFNIYLKKRLKGQILFPTAKDAYSKKIDYSKNKLLKLFSVNKKFKKLGIFAPHSFSDTNHGSGKFIFRDYFQHFKKTLDILNNDKETLWLIKPHPSRHFFKEQGVVENEIEKLNSNNVFLCPENLTPKSAILASDVFVSGRGSIGLEAACFGKKTILAGECFYSHLGFTYNPLNIKEYEYLITKKPKNKLTKSKIIIAKKAFYFQAFKNSSILKSMFPISNQINISLSNSKVKQKKIKPKNYLNELNQKFDIKKLFKDNLFVQFNKILLKEFE